MKAIIKIIIIRTIGLVFAVLTAITLAWVLTNMGTILGILSGNPPQNSAQEAPFVAGAAVQTPQSDQIIQEVGTLVLDNADSLVKNKDTVLSSSQDLNRLTDEMNTLIIKNKGLGFEQWPRCDQDEYCALELEHKAAATSYNASASKLSQIINEIRSDAYGIIESVVPGINLSGISK